MLLPVQHSSQEALAQLRLTDEEYAEAVVAAVYAEAAGRGKQQDEKTPAPRRFVVVPTGKHDRR